MKLPIDEAIREAIIHRVDRVMYEVKNVKGELIKATFRSVGWPVRSALQKTVLDLVMGGLEKPVGESTEGAVEDLVADTLQDEFNES